MTFSAVGTIVGTTNSLTFTWAPTTIGNFMLFAVTGTSTTSTPTGISGSNATWTPLTTVFTGTTNTDCVRIFKGVANSTSSATQTISWSGATPGSNGSAGQEFSSTAGASAVTLDVSGTWDRASGSTWTTLTPTHGAGELVFGFGLDTGAATWTNGTPAGYQYQNDANSNAMAYNLSAPNAATSPTFTDSGQIFGQMVLVYEASTAVAGPAPRVPIPPGLQSPMVLAEPLRFSTPAPPVPAPAPAPQLIPPGLQSPMALTEPPRPATQPPPPAPQPAPAPQLIPPGLMSPMSLAEPARPATQPAPPQQPPAPAPQLIPPGLMSPMSLTEASRPATSTPPPPPVVTVASPPPLLIPPGLQSPMALAVPVRPSTGTPPPPPPVVTPQPGTQQLIPPGRMSPMSLGLPMVQPPQAPSTPGPPGPIPPIPSGVVFGVQGAAGGDRDHDVRVFRSIMPGEIPRSGAELPKLHGRGYAGPLPERADDLAHDWLEEQAPPPPGPGVAEIVSDEAERLAAGLYQLGKILAPEPYQAPGKAKCGAPRKIGREWLTCKLQAGHGGMHSDRGVKWG